MQVLSHEEDFLLFCQFPGFGNEWLPVIGLGLDLTGGLILITAAWRAIFSEERGEKDARFAGFLKSLNKKAFKRVGQAPEAQLPPDTQRKAAKHFGNRARQTVVVGRKSEREGLILGAGLVSIGFLLQFIGSWPCS